MLAVTPYRTTLEGKAYLATNTLTLTLIKDPEPEITTKRLVPPSYTFDEENSWTPGT